jgi:rSAM/selenodomain-associated transferase 2
MISAVIPTLNAEARLPACLAALAAAKELVAEIVVADGGSTDATEAIAQQYGARLLQGPAGRGAQLARGADAARKGRWLLFLHADTVLETGWPTECQPLLQDESTACVFSLAFDDDSWPARLIAAGGMARTVALAAPYGDQGLLISRTLYEEIGGFRPLPLFEDVEIVDRLVRKKGRRALRILKSRAVTSAERYRRDGYALRVAKNFLCLSLYRAGVSPAKIAALYA